MTREIIAHVKKNVDGEWEIHSLDSHLMAVSALARGMAISFHSEDWAELAGLWHDFGKGRLAFQNYIAQVSGYNSEANAATARVDHSTAGAVYAVASLGESFGKILAYLIVGHHAGLPDWLPSEVSGQSALSVRLKVGEDKRYVYESPI